MGCSLEYTDSCHCASQNCISSTHVHHILTFSHLYNMWPDFGKPTKLSHLEFWEITVWKIWMNEASHWCNIITPSSQHQFTHLLATYNSPCDGDCLDFRAFETIFLRWALILGQSREGVGGMGGGWVGGGVGREVEKRTLRAHWDQLLQPEEATTTANGQGDVWPTMGAVSGPCSPISALYWRHFHQSRLCMHGKMLPGKADQLTQSFWNAVHR